MATFLKQANFNQGIGSHFRIQLYFDLLEQSIANNNSTVRYYLYKQADTNYTASGVSAPAYINGEHIGSFTSINGTQVLIGTKDVVIGHDGNGDGTANYSASADTNWTIGDASLSGSFGLPKIARAPSYTSTNASNITLNSARLTASINTQGLGITGGGWDLPTDGGATWTHYADNVTDKTITGLEPNKTYWYRGYAVTAGGGVNSSWKTFTTQNIARIASVGSTINCDTALTVTTNKNSATKVEIYIELLNDAKDTRVGEKISKIGVSATFTVAEMQSLANYLPTKNSSNFRVNVITNDVYNDFKDYTYSIVNANPIFSTFAFQDTNAKTVNLTGNDQKIIKSYSNLRATISSANKATARKGATMKSYQLVVGSKQATKNYSSSDNVTIDLSAIENNVFMLYAIDSRNNSTVIQKSPVEYINYFKPTSPSISLVRQSNVGNQVTLSFDGSFYNGTFGDSINNLAAIYKYKKTSDSTWISGETSLTLTKNGNNFNFSGAIKGDLGATGFNKDGYNIQIVITDLLESIVGSGLVSPAIPNIAIHKNGVGINAPYDVSKGGPFQIEGDRIDTLINNLILSGFNKRYPVGTIIQTTSGTNPNSYLGFGTWALWGTGRTPVGVDTSQTEFNTVQKTGGAKAHTLTEGQLPNVTGVIGIHSGDAGTNLWNGSGMFQPSMNEQNGHYKNLTSLPNGTGASSIITIRSSFGSNQAHNNLGPYITCYFWRRTA